MAGAAPVENCLFCKIGRDADTVNIGKEMSYKQNVVSGPGTLVSVSCYHFLISNWLLFFCYLIIGWY
jgi:hypothetical protein